MNPRMLCTLAALATATAAFAQAEPPMPPPAQPAPPPPPPVVRPDSQPGAPVMVPNTPMPPMMRPGYYEAPVGRMADFLFATIQSHKDDLKVTDEQMKAIQALNEPAMRERQTRFMDREAARRELQDLAKADPVDMTKVQAKVAAIGKTNADDMLSDIQLRDAIRKVLTADQRAKLKDLSPAWPAMPNMPRPAMGRPGNMPLQPGPARPAAPPTPAPGVPGAPMPAP